MVDRLSGEEFLPPHGGRNDESEEKQLLSGVRYNEYFTKPRKKVNCCFAPTTTYTNTIVNEMGQLWNIAPKCKFHASC